MNSEKKWAFILVADQDDRFLTYSAWQEVGKNTLIRFLFISAYLFAALEEQMRFIILIDYIVAPEPGADVLSGDG